MEYDSIKDIKKISLKALKDISLSQDSHKEIFQNDNLPILIHYLAKIFEITKDQTKSK